MRETEAAIWADVALLKCRHEAGMLPGRFLAFMSAIIFPS